MPAGINRAGSRGGSASVMVAAESFERVSALGPFGVSPGSTIGQRKKKDLFETFRESPPRKCLEFEGGVISGL
jgi:hypothetical protein